MLASDMRGDMEYWKLALEYIKVLVWPSAVAALALAFRREIRTLLRDRDVQVEALGANIALTRASAEVDAVIASQASAQAEEIGTPTTDARATPPTSSTEELSETDAYRKLAAQALAALSDEVRPVHPVGRHRGGPTGENRTLVRAWDLLAGDVQELSSVFSGIRQHVNPFIPLA
jgi:hypothetical protein